MELIDRKPILEYANEQITGIFAYPQGYKAEDEKAYREKWEYLRIILMSAPTIEIEPVKHGHWIWRGGNLYECSECEAIVVAQDYIPIELHMFCRGCGAKMDEVEE